LLCHDCSGFFRPALLLEAAWACQRGFWSFDLGPDSRGAAQGAVSLGYEAWKTFCEELEKLIPWIFASETIRWQNGAGLPHNIGASCQKSYLRVRAPHVSTFIGATGALVAAELFASTSWLWCDANRIFREGAVAPCSSNSHRLVSTCNFT
jgi:hypothetical protein